MLEIILSQSYNNMYIINILCPNSDDRLTGNSYYWDLQLNNAGPVLSKPTGISATFIKKMIISQHSYHFNDLWRNLGYNDSPKSL